MVDALSPRPPAAAPPPAAATDGDAEGAALLTNALEKRDLVTATEAPPAQVEPETASLMTTHVISHEQVQLEAIDYSKQVTTDHGQVRMTPEQKALYIARQRMQISRSDTEMYQVVHTLALALGAIRTEAGTHKALFAALVLLNRPDMSEQEVCLCLHRHLDSQLQEVAEEGAQRSSRLASHKCKRFSGFLVDFCSKL